MRSSGPRAIFLTASAALVILALAGLGHWIAVVIHRVPAIFAPTPEKLVWDLRKGHVPAAVNWPAGRTSEWYERKGQFDLTIIGRNGNVIFHQQVQHFDVQRKGDTLGVFIIHFASNSDGEEAYGLMKQIMSDWKFPPEQFTDLEKWHDAIASKMSHGDFVQLHQRLNDMHNGLDFALYPGFKAGAGGDTEIRASEVGGHGAESGRLNYTLTFSF